MQINLKLGLLGLPIFLAPLTHADLNIYPSKGLFGLEQECRQQQQKIEINGSSIMCDFKNAVNNDAIRKQNQELFEQGLKQGFGPQIVPEITQRTKNRTYVASLDVLRASKYVVTKESTSEIFLPVTLSLKLTNILTGEVIYSNSSTLSQPIKVLTSEINTPATNQEIAKQYQITLLTLTQKVTSDLKSKLQISEINTNVLDRWKSYLILDKGFNQGIAKNDELNSSDGGLIRVVHADSDYAVATPILLADNAKTFTKISSSARQAVNKPKALVVDVSTFQGESKDLVEQIFSDAVGENASFSLTPVNKRYAALASSIGSQTELAQAEDINQRELPEFFIRINVLPTIGFEQKTGYMTNQQTVHTEVMGEMIDRSGRVIFSALANDEIKEVIAEGMGFALDARREISLKNALIKLGHQFQKGVKFTRTDLKISDSSDKTITIDDLGERLSTGMKIHIYNEQKMSGRKILIPTWEATVTERHGTKVKAQLDFPINGADRLPVRSGDNVLLDSTAPVGDSKLARVFCPSLDTEQVGEIPFYAFGPLTYHAFSESKRPFYATGSSFKGQSPLIKSVLELTQYAGFKKSLNLQFHTPTEECLQPALKTQIKENSMQCNPSQSNCNATLIMTAGVRRFNRLQEKIGSYGLQQEIELKGIDHQFREQMFNMQLLDASPKILQQIVQKADTTP